MKTATRALAGTASYRFTAFVLVAGLFMLFVGRGWAATRTWDGGGANDRWMSHTNWVGDVAPGTNDDLVFPTSAAQLINFNDFPAGTTFNSITFTETNVPGSAFFLQGNPVRLNAGILSTNQLSANSIAFTITLTAPQTIRTHSGNLFLSDIDNNGNTLTADITTFTYFGGPITGAGGIFKKGPGLAVLTSSNTYLGVTTVDAGALRLWTGASLGATNGGTIVTNAAVLELDTTAETFNEPLVLSGGLQSASLLNSVGTNVWSGPISLAGGTSSAQVAVSADRLTINGVISGGGFVKEGLGSLVLGGTNSHTGATRIAHGMLLINGSQPASAVLLDDDPTVVLGGYGTCGPITASGGTVNPGSSPGLLNSGAVNLSASSSFDADVNGTNVATGYDQLSVTGSVNLGDAHFNMNVLNFTPAIGDNFVLIKNDGSDPVVGTFFGVPDGYLFTNGLLGVMQVLYTGGSGNDVVLRRVGQPAQFTSIASLTNRFKLLSGVGESTAVYTIQATTNLSPPTVWTAIGSDIADGSGLIQFTDTNAVLFPMRFYRILSP